MARLKAAVQKDQRAFDSVMETERTYAYLLSTEVGQYGRAPRPSREPWMNYYTAITEKLMVDRGMT